MPIRAPKAPSPELVGEMAKQTGFFRMEGPSKTISNPSRRHLNKIKDELSPLAASVKRAIDTGKAISVQSQMSFEILEKLQRGETITPQEEAIVWTLAQEAKGDGNIGGIKDENSIFYIDKPDLQTSSFNRLNDMQKRIEMHLTGVSRFYGPEEARGVFRLDKDYARLRDTISQERFSAAWRNLSEDQKREVRGQAMEDLVRLQTSNEVSNLLNQVGTNPEKSQLDDALQSNNPKEKLLAQMASKEKLTDLRLKILRQRSEIDKMNSIDDLQRFIGLDPTDPNQAGILTGQNIAEAIIARNNLPKTEADLLRGNPNLVFDATKPYSLKASTVDLTDFVGDLYQRKLQRYALERSATTPDVLKKPKVELKDDIKKQLDAKDGAFALLLELGNGNTTDPATLLSNKLGIDHSTALRFINEGFTQGILTNPNGPGTPEVAVNLGNISIWGKPEMIATAMNRGFIDEATIRAQLDSELTPKIPDSAARNAEINRRLEEIKQLQKAVDPNALKQEQIAGAKKFDKQTLAMILVMSASMLPQVVGSLDDEDKQQLAGHLQ